MSGNFIDKYPYTDFHELNLDWIIKTVKESEKKIDDFTVFNALTWAGNWDASKSYVKWSIVQDSNGNGFLSTQAVPANVSLSNKSYWTQISKYEALYAAFNSRIESNAASIASHSQQLSKLNNSYFYKNRKFYFIGDSYASISKFTPTPWPIFLGNKMGLSLGTNYFYASQGSGGFYAKYNGRNFLTCLQSPELYQGASGLNKNEITDIVVAGGYNDMSQGASLDNIAYAMSEFKEYIKSNYPNVERVYCAMIGHSYNLATQNESLRNMVSKYAYGCAVNHFAFCPEASMALMNYSTDLPVFNVTESYDGWNFHPNEHGSDLISCYLSDFIAGGKFTEYTIPLLAKLTAADGVTWLNDTAPSLYSQIIGDKIYIQNTNTFCPIVPYSQTLASGFYRICSIENTYFNTHPASRALFNVPCYIATLANSQTYSTSVNLLFINGNIYLQPHLSISESNISSGNIRFLISTSAINSYIVRS